MISLSSRPESIARIEPLVQKLANRYNIGQEKYPDILISLTEAVNNAIIHGNNQSQEKHVTIRSRVLSKKLVVQVSDEGRGFDYDNLADPTTEELIECCGGRGVFLIKNLSDQVTFHDNGSTIEMLFEL